MFRYEFLPAKINEKNCFRMHFNHNRKDTRFIMHWHEDIELLYFVSGEAEVITNNISVKVKPGQLAVVNANYLHKVQSDDEAYYYCIIVNGGFLDTFGISTFDTKLERLVDSEEIRRLFDSIIREFNERPSLYQTHIKADILSVMVELFRNHISVQKAEYNDSSSNKLDITKRVLRYVHQHFREALTLDTVADATGFSKYYISHLFKEVVGCSLIQYLNRLRCCHARDLLVFENYTVSEVAEMCGFENVSYFSQTYKKHMQTLPGKEKKNT